MTLQSFFCYRNEPQSVELNVKCTNYTNIAHMEMQALEGAGESFWGSQFELILTTKVLLNLKTA